MMNPDQQCEICEYGQFTQKRDKEPDAWPKKSLQPVLVSTAVGKADA